ncbi:MAG: DUF3089 domain-containing protein [Elusimicrobiota bacterium]|jgi:hypothetical protein|nr:DUF3089 domain-containing protein [Elusimicrobiota bacterium]
MSTAQPICKADYTKEENWVHLPKEKNGKFDIFYIYPTVFIGAPGELMPLGQKRFLPAIQRNMLKTTGICSTLGNIYAPFYRQAALSTIKLTLEEKRKVLQTSVLDVVEAFEHFLKYHNNGRPFALIGHSQGSRMLRKLMKLKFNNAALQSKLIAAYLIGVPLPKSDIIKYPWLKPAQNASEAGVIITYNTQAEGIENSPFLEGVKDIICTSPLNWSLENAPKSLNKGAVFFDENAKEKTTVNNFTGAYVDKKTGALITPDVDIDRYSSRIFMRGVFHQYDYEFFYRNLQENFKTRLANF